MCAESLVHLCREEEAEFGCMVPEKVITIELDIQRDHKCDFTLPAVQKRWLQRIDRGKFFAVVVTPPCSTFSRAVWANEAGPYPLRSHLFLRGFPWNARAQKDKAQFGNILADFAFEALRRQFKHEQYVGRTKKERIPEHSPTSMWQFQQFPDVITVVFSQLDFGLESVKPTRFLMCPRFGGEGWYIGPLPKRVGTPLYGVFRTAAAALAAPMAEAIVTSYQQYRGKGGGSCSFFGKRRLVEEEVARDCGRVGSYGA